MELSLPTINVQIFNFLLFAGVLYWFLFRPLGKVLAERKGAIARDFDEAREAREKAEKIKEEYEERLRKTNEDSAEIIANAVSSAETISKDIIAKANSAADRIRERNEAEIADARSRMYREINKEVGELAVSIAGKLLEGSLDESAHRSLIDTFTEKVESGDVR